MKKLTLIVPCFNEVENIDLFYTEAFKVLDTLGNYKTEILFIDDGSTDGTDIKIQVLAEKDDRVKFLIFGRNFGKEVAVSAGFHNTNSDAIIIVDADLQYPLDKIPEFVEQWEKGFKVVCGIRDAKKTNNWVEKIGSKYFYKIMNTLSDVKINPRALDFRLLDREVIDKFNKFTEKGRIVRSLIDWLGYETGEVHYTENPRLHGKASFSFIKRLNLALNAITSNSVLPLKLVGVVGIFISIFAALLIFWFLYDRYLREIPEYFLSGTYLVGSINMFFVGVILMALGLIAYYIGGIREESLNRPLYSIKTRSVL